MLNQIVGSILLVVGLFFCVVGVIGIMRFPDVYSRIHASGKVSSMGIVGILLGLAFLMPETALKAILLGAFVVIVTPVTAHVIALAAHRQGIARVNVKRDDLAQFESGEE